MKFEVNLFEFKKALGRLQKITKIKSTNEILNMLHIKGIDSSLTLTMTNLDVYIKTSVFAKIQEAGELLLPEETIELIKELNADYFTIDDINLYAGKKMIQFMYVDPDNYSICKFSPETHEFTVTEGELYRLLEVNYACAKDEVRPVLQGICINNNEFVALDGYRMSVRKSNMFKSELDKAVMSYELWFNLLKQIKPESNNLVYVYSEHKMIDGKDKVYSMSFKLVDGTEVIGRCITDSNFVDYKSITPDEFKTVTKVYDAKELYKELKFIIKLRKGMSSKNTLEVRFAFKKDDNIKLKAKNEKNVVETEVYGETEGEDLSIFFDMAIIIDTFSLYKYNLKLKCVSSISPMVVTADDDNYDLVLPIRVIDKY